MAAKHDESIDGTFRHVIFSPKGGIEGALVDAGGQPVQIVFDHQDEATPVAFGDLKPGQKVVVEGTAKGPSEKGKAEHPVFGFVRLVSIDGRKPAPRKAAADPAYSGVVVRFNFARHGAANGVVLDTGDFVHTKPEGLGRLKLKIGDKVRVDGDARVLVTGSGRAIEAASVNGKRVRRD